MSDIMRPMSIGHLMNWALSEYKKKGSIFGIDKLVHYTSGQALPIYEEKIESPFRTSSRSKYTVSTKHHCFLCSWF